MMALIKPAVKPGSNTEGRKLRLRLAMLIMKASHLTGMQYLLNPFNFDSQIADRYLFLFHHRVVSHTFYPPVKEDGMEWI